MATDNFLDKKSVLGLAERVPMCPPETIVFADSIQWGGVSLLNKNQHQYSENISAINVSNREMIRKLAIGQSIACKIKINAEQEILPLFLVSKTKDASASNSTTYITKGTTVLNDGKIAGVIFEYIYQIIQQSTGLSRIVETLNCHVYIHDWGEHNTIHYYLMERIIKYRHARALTLSISQRTIFRTIILVIFVGESVWQQKSGSSRL